MSSVPSLANLLGICDPRVFDPGRAWASRPPADRLRVPIGVAPGGETLVLDLKEPAWEGMGPHGLILGTTGSGKSELLRALVLALALTHSPDTLNFVLVDSTGRDTFAMLDRLPHTSAVVSNAAGAVPPVDEMAGALGRELVRRADLLRRAGDSYYSQWVYERARAAGVPLAPLPSLLVVCDGFTELVSARPTALDMFVEIGRRGRWAGVHMLLAGRRLDEVRLRGLVWHLNYRIGLRTSSAAESLDLLGVADAFRLPRTPGQGYLKVADRPATPFRTVSISRAPEGHDADVQLASRRLADLLTERLAGRGRQARRL